MSLGFSKNKRSIIGNEVTHPHQIIIRFRCQQPPYQKPLMSSPGISIDNPGGPYVQEWAGKRFIFTTNKTFGETLCGVRETVAPPPADMFNENKVILSTTEDFAESVIKAANQAKRPSGLLLFKEFSDSRFKKFFPDTPRFHKFVIGNPLSLKEIAQYDVSAALHAPWNFLVVELHDDFGKPIGNKIILESPVAMMASEIGGKALDAETEKLEKKFLALVTSWL